MIEPLPGGSGPSVPGTTSTPDLGADRHAVDREPFAPAVVGLHEHADGPVVVPLTDAPAGGADAALEVVADHPGAAADGSFLDRPADAAAYASRACSAVTWKPSTSLR